MSSPQRPNCDHPDCTDDALNTYTDASGNDLDVCPAHYWWLVSGHKPDALKETFDFPSVGTLDAPTREIGRQPAAGGSSIGGDRLPDGHPLKDE